jgi:hypothetical protein
MNQGKLRFILRCNISIRLAAAGQILYLWRPAVPSGKVPSVKTDSPWETAKRRGWKSVWAFAAREALRQVGSFELQARNADEGQRAFSWLLFY